MVHRSVVVLCTLCVLGEAGFSYPSGADRGCRPDCSSALGLLLSLVTQPQANENKSDPHCERNAARHRHL